MLGEAGVSEVSQIKPYYSESPQVKAKPFSPHDVWLLPSPFHTLLEVNGRYLLSLEPDRLVSLFRKTAGLPQKAEPYGGWEIMGIAGHSLGHLLSALAWHYAVTASSPHLDRCSLLVEMLAECQRARSDGYFGAIPDADRVWAEIRKGELNTKGFDLNGIWVPWYTLHKMFAGLIDVHLLTGNKLALETAVKLADWAVDLTKDLNPDQWQTMLACEHGGMNESLLDLHRLTGKQAHLDLAHKFDHKNILDPLRRGEDPLAGVHSNTQVPKIIGLAKEYERSGKSSEKAASLTFWDRIARARTYANGGNSNFEYLGPAGKLRDALSASTTETCNTYNMLKLSRHIFSWEPSAEVGDYIEKALFNHILSSQDGTEGGFTYFIPLVSRALRPFSKPFDDFWCCVGTGMENPSRVVESIYFATQDELIVNLFLPSRLEWKAKEAVLNLSCDILKSPEVTLTLAHAEKKEFALAIRKPGWMNGDLTVKVNGAPVASELGKDGFVRVKRTWISGDKVTWGVPSTLRFEGMPDDPRRVAIFNGPFLLAAESAGLDYDPCFVSEGLDFLGSFAAQAESGKWAAKGISKPKDLEFRPFYTFTQDTYSTYFDVLTPAQWLTKEAEIKAQAAKDAALAAATTDLLRVGEMQPERDHNFQAMYSQTGAHQGRNWRHANVNSWFQFDMKVDPRAEHQVIFTFWSGDKGRDFKLLVNEETLVDEVMAGPTEPGFFDRAIDLPKELTEGREKITIRFVASSRTVSPGLYGCRVVRKGV